MKLLEVVLGLHRTTVGRILTLGVMDLIREDQGQKRCTRLKNDPYLKVTTLRKRTVTSTDIKCLVKEVRNVDISKQTF